MKINITRRFDDTKVTHALHDMHIPAGEAWSGWGYVFVATDVAATLGTADSIVSVAGRGWPAWTIEMDECCREVN